MSSKKVKTWVILSDLHYPVHDEPSWKAVLNFISRNKIAGIVLLGDFLDCQNVSRHTKDKPRLRKRGGYQQDIQGFQRDILKPLEERLPRGCKKICIFGNHERFIDDLCDESPALEGTVDIDNNLQLTRRGWKVIPVGGHFKLNGVLLLHGDQIGCSVHVSKKLVDETCRVSVMGHVHRYSVSTKVGLEPTDKWIGITLPCLSTTSPEYLKGKLNAYLNGFGICEVWGAHRNNIYVPIIMNGQFSYGGRIYR